MEKMLGLVGQVEDLEHVSWLGLVELYNKVLELPNSAERAVLLDALMASRWSMTHLMNACATVRGNLLGGE
jgi:hypothetical protein